MNDPLIGVMSILSESSHMTAFDFTTMSSGSPGCPSDDLHDPKIILRAAHEDSDYGYGGEIFPCTRAAQLVLQAHCNRCRTDVEHAFDIDDDVDLLVLLHSLSTGPSTVNFLAATRVAAV